ncbi:MAG: YfjI family protein [Chloroflexota bacterium]|nr:YfjI family protein [Chloroflexota bacterium]MDP9473385.1 YfjI family protein [Chloroflexota bacterium]
MVGTDPTILLQQLTGRPRPSANGAHVNGTSTKTGDDPTDNPDKTRSVSFGSAYPALETEILWAERRQLPPAVAPAPEMTENLLPEPFRCWVAEAAERVKLPIEMVATPAIAAAGAVIGRRVGIRPGEYDDYTVVPNFWGAVVARSGWMKSTAVQEAFRPVGRLAAAARERHERGTEAMAVRRERIEAEVDAIKKRMRDAAKDNISMDDLEEDLLAKRKDLAEAIDTERRYLTHDATVEKLGELLRENPRGMLVLRDELSGWLRALDRAGREGDREFFLEAWNGTGSYTVDRIGRGTIHIPSLTVSIFGGIQPGKLRPLVDSAVDGGEGDDGLLQRFQLLVWPDSLKPWAKPTGWPDKAARDRADAVFERLADLDPSGVGAVTAAAIPYLRFSPDAQRAHDRWRDGLESRIRSGELDDAPSFASHIAKYRSLVPALALTFWLIDHLDGSVSGTTAGSVDQAAVDLAVKWAVFLEAHARKVYGAELDGGASTAHALKAKLEDGAVLDGQSVRDLIRAQWSGLATPERVWAALSLLQEHEWLRIETIQPLGGGRPSQIVRLHPELIR